MSDDPRLHYERFQRNAALAARLEQTFPEEIDWCCVLMFYGALHLLDAYLTTKFLPFKIETHSDRQALVRRYPELRRFGQSYRELQQLSEQVRYDVEFNYNDGHHLEVKRHFGKVVSVLEPWVKNLLGTT